MTDCAHGYLDLGDCPRCAPRPVRTVAPAAPAHAMTRWHGTNTTLGPAAKLGISTALLVPTLVFLLGLAAARQHPENAFLAVPLGVFAILDVVLLPHVWERGRRSP